MTTETTLTDQVYGDWEWNEQTNRPDNIYPARITGRWSGGVEFLTDRATVARMVAAQIALREQLSNPEDTDALALDGDGLVLTDVEGTIHRYEPDAEGLYHCGFGWTWHQWTDDDDEAHPTPSAYASEYRRNTATQTYLEQWAKRHLAEGDPDREQVDAVIELLQETLPAPPQSLPTENIVAYAVHVDGGMWDDPEISAWCESIDTAARMMERAEAFFADDDDFGIDDPKDGGLLTIVRAVFTPYEWAETAANGWTYDTAMRRDED